MHNMRSIVGPIFRIQTCSRWKKSAFYINFLITYKILYAVFSIVRMVYGKRCHTMSRRKMHFILVSRIWTQQDRPQIVDIGRRLGCPLVHHQQCYVIEETIITHPTKVPLHDSSMNAEKEELKAFKTPKRFTNEAAISDSQALQESIGTDMNSLLNDFISQQLFLWMANHSSSRHHLALICLAQQVPRQAVHRLTVMMIQNIFPEKLFLHLQKILAVTLLHDILIQPSLSHFKINFLCRNILMLISTQVSKKRHTLHFGVLWPILRSNQSIVFPIFT